MVQPEPETMHSRNDCAQFFVGMVHQSRTSHTIDESICHIDAPATAFDLLFFIIAIYLFAAAELWAEQWKFLLVWKIYRFRFEHPIKERQQNDNLFSGERCTVYTLHTNASEIVSWT